MGGSGPHEGRVEVFHNGQWGTVCDDNWSMNDATVLCRQLGYEQVLAVHREAFFGEGTGPIWYDNLLCVGTETSLAQCPHNGIGVHNCNHSEDAGVTCDGKPFDFRFIDSHNYYSVHCCHGNRQNLVGSGPHMMRKNSDVTQEGSCGF